MVTSNRSSSARHSALLILGLAIVAIYFATRVSSTAAVPAEKRGGTAIVIGNFASIPRLELSYAQRPIESAAAFVVHSTSPATVVWIAVAVSFTKFAAPQIFVLKKNVRGPCRIPYRCRIPYK